MQKARTIHALSILIAAGLTACKAPTQRQTAAEQVAPKPTEVPAPPVTRAVWSFSSAQNCVATASSSIIAIGIETTDSAVTWTVRGPLAAMAPGQRHVRLAFAGNHAAWTIIARRAPRGQLIASMPLSEYAAGRILVMLGGGALQVGTGSDVRTIVLPGSGQDGARWFGCVRDHLLP